MNDEPGGADRSAPFFQSSDHTERARGLGAGDRIGRYRIVRELGVGGMGIVYEATRDDLQRPVAIKTLHSFVRGDAATKRLLREAEALARLDHPGIARILDVFSESIDERDVFFLVMELAHGLPVTEAVEGLPIRQRLRLFVEVCRAVEHAHLRGVVHRDLKPSNIVVGESGRVVVLDFGLARLLEEEPNARITRTGQFIGTLAYMSPEQCAESGGAVDLRSDVYSLGVLLYEMLTGALPIDIPSGSIVRAMRSIELAPPTPPSKLDAALRGDLDQIVLKALEKNPARRYESASAMAQDIERHLEHRPIVARPPTTLYRASRYVRRHRTMVVATGAVIVALSVGLGIATMQMVRAREAERRATERFDDVRSLAHTVIFDLHDAIEDLPGATAARALLVESALEYLDRLAQDPPANNPEFRIELAKSYVQLGSALYGSFAPNLLEVDHARAAYRQALDQISAAGPLDLAPPEAVRVVVEAILGKLSVDASNAEMRDLGLVLSERIVLRESAADEDWRLRAKMLTIAGLIAADRNEFDVSVGFLDEATEAMTNVSREGTTQAANRLVLAMVFFRQGEVRLRFDQAEEAIIWLTRACEESEKGMSDVSQPRQFMYNLIHATSRLGMAQAMHHDANGASTISRSVDLAQQYVALDPTDQYGIRGLEVVLFDAGEALTALASSDRLASEERIGLMRDALAHYQSAQQLTDARLDRGQLPIWESHYPDESAAAIAKAQAALDAALADRTSIRGEN